MLELLEGQIGILEREPFDVRLDGHRRRLGEKRVTVFPRVVGHAARFAVPAVKGA